MAKGVVSDSEFKKAVSSNLGSFSGINRAVKLDSPFGPVAKRKKTRKANTVDFPVQDKREQEGTVQENKLRENRVQEKIEVSEVSTATNVSEVTKDVVLGGTGVPDPKGGAKGADVLGVTKDVALGGTGVPDPEGGAKVNEELRQDRKKGRGRPRMSEEERAKAKIKRESKAEDKEIIEGEGSPKKETARTKLEEFPAKFNLRLSNETLNEFHLLALKLQQQRARKGERITVNSIMRAALSDFLEYFDVTGADSPSTEEEIVELVKVKRVKG